MTGLAAFLEDFGAARAGGRPSVAVPDEGALEAAKLEGFDGGYRAGWDDAIKAQSDDQSRISSDFAQNLQDLSFTYHEACNQVLNAISPLLEEVVVKLLPAALHQTLGLHLAEQLRAIE